jgi:hypothetical protein
MPLRTPLLAAALFACGLSPALAQNDIRTERVQFKPGTSGATVKGEIKGYETVDYVLEAGKGQNMNVSMATNNSANYFNILAPGENDVAMFIGSTSGNLLEENRQTEERAQGAEAQFNAASFRIQQLIDQIKLRGQDPDDAIEPPTSWKDFDDWCDNNLAGRVALAPPSRVGMREPLFEDSAQAARCLLWLANDYRDRRLQGGGGSFRDHVLEPDIRNTPCGADEFRVWWQGQMHVADWHIKNGGKDPRRCLRIYYFWDEATQQVVIADMPAHRDTAAS